MLSATLRHGVLAAWAAMLLLLHARACLAGSDPQAPCAAAALEAEARFGLPEGLLEAIGRVESGRWDPATGTVAPWPWTINANGAGRSFRTEAEAVAETRALLRSGVPSIDLGCFQINLAFHPSAFSGLEEAFDPVANANYAAKFLVALRQRLGTWDAAVAAYHSAIPERGGPYRDRVLAGWSRAPARPARAATPICTVLWTQAPPGTAVRIWTPSAPGSAPNVITIRTTASGRR